MLGNSCKYCGNGHNSQVMRIPEKSFKGKWERLKVTVSQQRKLSAVIPGCQSNPLWLLWLSITFTPICPIPKLCYTPALGPKRAYSWYLVNYFHTNMFPKIIVFMTRLHPFLSVFLFQVSSQVFKFQVLFVTYTTIQRLYNQQWNESRVRSMDSANIEKTTQGK